MPLTTSVRWTVSLWLILLLPGFGAGQTKPLASTSPFAVVVRSNFDQWDLDRNGKVTPAEIDQCVQGADGARRRGRLVAVGIVNREVFTDGYGTAVGGT